MRTAWIVCLLVAGVLCGLPSGGYAGNLSIPGTGACEAVLKSVAAAYERARPMARVAIPPSVHSEGGIRQVISGQAVLARVSRPLTREEAAKKLTYRVFARDAAVFAVGSGVRARGFTIRQIVDIFTGKVTRWEELAAGKGPIRVLLREQGDASLRVLMAHYPEIRDLRFTNQGKILYRDLDMVDMLQKYRNSVGFATMSSLGAASVAVTPLAIDEVTPTKESISSGRYPVVIEYAVVYREDTLTREASEFLDFLFSRDGKDAMSDCGVSPAER